MSGWAALRGAISAVWRRSAAMPSPAVDVLGAATLSRVPYDAVVTPPKPGALVNWGVPVECFDLSHAFEGFRPRPYQDGGGVWTIGYGSTRDMSGKPVTRWTTAISEADARDLAARDLAHAASLMAADFPAGLPPRWWAVGVLMCNNLGRMSVWGATLLTMLRAGHFRQAAEQMGAYRNIRVDGVLTPSLGLRRRRWAEAAYALGMDAGEARRRAWAEIHKPQDWPALP